MKTLTEILLENSGLRIAAVHVPTGKMTIGRPGQIHADLVDDDYDHHKMGFVDHKGNFMDREQAFKYALKNPSTLDKKEFLSYKHYYRQSEHNRRLMSHDLRGCHGKKD